MYAVNIIIRGVPLAVHRGIVTGAQIDTYINTYMRTYVIQFAFWHVPGRLQKARELRESLCIS